MVLKWIFEIQVNIGNLMVLKWISEIFQRFLRFGDLLSVVLFGKKVIPVSGIEGWRRVAPGREAGGLWRRTPGYCFSSKCLLFLLVWTGRQSDILAQKWKWQWLLAILNGILELKVTVTERRTCGWKCSAMSLFFIFVLLVLLMVCIFRMFPLAWRCF